MGGLDRWRSALALVPAPHLEEGLSGPVPGADTSGQMCGQREPRLRIPDWKKIGGWYPKLHSNGDRPVADTGNELCAYSTHESCWLQEDGFWETTHRNIRSKSWLALSVWPLLWGWYPEERLTVAPNKRQNSLQNLETNWGPLSETTSVGRPWMRKTWSMTATAVSLADGNLGRGMKWAAFENRSTMVKTTVFLLEGGRPVTKSSEMWDQGLDGTDSGWRSPAEGRLEVLEMAQTEQAKTNHRISRAIHGHQNRCLIRNMVRLTPGWQATLEQWLHRMTLDRKVSGTNKRPGGHPDRGVTPCEAVRTFDSISHVTAETNSLWHNGLGKRRSIRLVENTGITHRAWCS